MIDQRWLILVVLFVARSSFGYQFQSVASSAALIEAELHVGYAAIGTLIGLYTIPGAFLSLPGGVLGARFGDRAVGAAGLVLMIGGGLLTCAGDTVLPLTAGRLISGAGAVLFSLVLNKMIIDWFAGREIVFAMGTLLSSWPFGIALGLMVQARIAESFGWRTGMAIAALSCLLALVLILVVYRLPPDTPARAGGGDTWWNPPDWLSLRSVLIAASAWGCLNVGLIIMFSFGAGVLAVRGMSTQDAASITSIALWISIFSVPVGGISCNAAPDHACWRTYPIWRRDSPCWLSISALGPSSLASRSALCSALAPAILRPCHPACCGPNIASPDSPYSPR
jgi:MFS family permease